MTAVLQQSINLINQSVDVIHPIRKPDYTARQQVHNPPPFMSSVCSLSSRIQFISI